MRKIFSIIYQYYLLKEFKYSYLDTLLTMVLLISIHVFILEELLIKLDFKNKSTIVLFQNGNFSLLLSFGLTLFFFIFYSKKKLLEKVYNKSDLKTGIQKLLIYFGALFIVLLILQNT